MSTKKDNDHSLGGVLKKFIDANKLQHGIDKVHAREAWAKMMGNGVNNYTTAVELRNGILYVTLSSSVLREELAHGTSKIVSLINEELGRDLIKKLVLR